MRLKGGNANSTGKKGMSKAEKQVMWGIILFTLGVFAFIGIFAALNSASNRSNVSIQGSAHEERRIVMAQLVPLTIQDEECGTVVLQFTAAMSVTGTTSQMATFGYQRAGDGVSLSTTVRRSQNIILTGLSCSDPIVGRFDGFDLSGNAIIWTTATVSQ